MTAPSKISIRLRGHHLLCVLTFMGKGYTPAFIENLGRVADSLTKGAAIVIVEGIDDVCAAMHNEKGALCESGEHCLGARSKIRDRLALVALSEALDRPLPIGGTIHLSPADYHRLRRLFTEGKIRQACEGCKWNGLCTAIAERGFRGTRLLSPHKYPTP
jgi:hypothetical protein